MTALPIVCDNCGAKYKLPESFKGSQSKCQKCGSVIDVDRQRGAADTAASKLPAAGARPAVARPAAAARPAVDRSKELPPPVERPAARRTPARRGREERGDGGGRGRRERGKRSNLPLVLGGIGVVAVVVLVVWMLVGGGPPKAR